MCGEVTLWASWPLLAMPLGYWSSGKALLVPAASFLHVRFEMWGLLLPCAYAAVSEQGLLLPMRLGGMGVASLKRRVPA
jgi:hypothetical protein